MTGTRLGPDTHAGRTRAVQQRKVLTAGSAAAPLLR